MKLGELISKTVYIDSNVLIAAIEPDDPHPAFRLIFREIDRASVRAVTSDLALAEVLAKPVAYRNATLVSKYSHLITETGPLTGLPIDRQVLIETATIRASGATRLADAIHVATARLSRCDYFLTLDDRLGRSLNGEPLWIRPTDIVP